MSPVMFVVEEKTMLIQILRALVLYIICFFSLAAAPLNVEALFKPKQVEASLKHIHGSKLSTGCFRLNRA